MAFEMRASNRTEIKPYLSQSQNQIETVKYILIKT